MKINEMLKKWQNLLAIFISLVTIIGIITTFLNSIDNRYASAAEFKELKIRYEYDKSRDIKSKLQDRIWQLEDRYKNMNSAPQSVKDEYRKLKEELKEVEDTLKSLKEYRIK